MIQINCSLLELFPSISQKHCATLSTTELLNHYQTISHVKFGEDLTYNVNHVRNAISIQNITTAPFFDKGYKQ